MCSLSMEYMGGKPSLVNLTFPELQQGEISQGDARDRHKDVGGLLLRNITLPVGVFTETFFAVDFCKRALVETVFFRVFELTVGVLSSAISFAALACSLFGTRLTLWLAVLLRRSRGTCWKARVFRSCFDRLTLSSRALISNSRARMNFSVSMPPLPNAFPVV